MLFRFAAPCVRTEEKWTAAGLKLSEAHRLPCFAELGGTKPFADMRLAWNEQGIAVNVTVRGKEQPLWCRDSRIDDSDGVQIFIDTRNTQNIHRASRFCHRFAFLPIGAGRKLDEPLAVLLAINRAKESPREMETGALKMRCQRLQDGYAIEAFIPAAALTGYSPTDQPAIGFSYAVIDRELGWQTFTVGQEMPFLEDPSLWGTLELTR
jgi:cellulose/xylan binding protein with CBM9 domain